MQERAVEAHTMIDHQQIAFEREGMVGREDDDAVGGRDHERAGRHRDVGARMVRFLLTALVDALRPEIGRDAPRCRPDEARSEAHTSELQSLMRNSYAVFCLKKK